MSLEERNRKPLRILFIGKRFYTNRDAYKERFGRIFQLPYWWAQEGHSVDLWLVDYHGSRPDVSSDGALKIETTPVLRWRFIARLLASCVGRWRSSGFDVVVGSGDCYLGLTAYVIALCNGARFIFDVYDRYDVFEGYRRLPGFDPLSFLLGRSWLATFASAKVLDDLKPLTGRSFLVPNGLDVARFRPLPMLDSRQQFGLPQKTSLVGYFGSMEPERGICDLIDATALLRNDGIDVDLVIGGKADPAIDLDRPWVHYLGNIDFEKMPSALASCDLLALPYRQGAFVDNASSCKIAEYIAVERPIVATRSPNLTQNFPEQTAQLEGLLAAPGDKKGLANCLRAQLLQRRLVSMPDGMSWQEISASVLKILLDQIPG